MKKKGITVIGSNHPIQSIKFPENPDPIQFNPIQSMDGSNLCPTLEYTTSRTRHRPFRLWFGAQTAGTDSDCDWLKQLKRFATRTLKQNSFETVNFWSVLF